MDQQNMCVAQIWALGPPVHVPARRVRASPLLRQSWHSPPCKLTIQLHSSLLRLPKHTHLRFSYSNVTTVPRPTTFFYGSVLLFPSR